MQGGSLNLMAVNIILPITDNYLNPRISSSKTRELNPDKDDAGHIKLMRLKPTEREVNPSLASETLFADTQEIHTRTNKHCDILIPPTPAICNNEKCKMVHSLEFVKVTPCLS